MRPDDTIIETCCRARPWPYGRSWLLSWRPGSRARSFRWRALLAGLRRAQGPDQRGDPLGAHLGRGRYCCRLNNIYLVITLPRIELRLLEPQLASLAYSGHRFLRIAPEFVQVRSFGRQRSRRSTRSQGVDPPSTVRAPSIISHSLTVECLIVAQAHPLKADHISHFEFILATHRCKWSESCTKQTLTQWINVCVVQFIGNENRVKWSNQEHFSLSQTLLRWLINVEGWWDCTLWYLKAPRSCWLSSLPSPSTRLLLLRGSVNHSFKRGPSIPGAQIFECQRFQELICEPQAIGKTWSEPAPRLLREQRGQSASLYRSRSPSRIALLLSLNCRFPPPGWNYFCSSPHSLVGRPLALVAAHLCSRTSFTFAL